MTELIEFKILEGASRIILGIRQCIYTYTIAYCLNTDDGKFPAIP